MWRIKTRRQDNLNFFSNYNITIYIVDIYMRTPYLTNAYVCPMLKSALKLTLAPYPLRNFKSCQGRMDQKGKTAKRDLKS